MNEIVWKHYPVEKLPEDLRELLDPSRPVTILLQQAADARASSNAHRIDPIAAETPNDEMSLMQIVDEMQDRRVRSDDPVKRIRAPRAEWDRREELHDRIRAGHGE